ncbi:MAG: DUF6236 family protein [Lysinibacillus sp.]
MRGIVINPKFEILEEGVLLKTTHIEPEDLRKYLLFWDRIDFPSNNVIYLGDNVESQFLINAGIMQRTMHQLNGFSGNMEHLFADLQYKTFLDNNKKEKGMWSIAQTSNQLILNPNDLIKKRAIEFELINCVPIPTVDVPLETILEFKTRRNDELLAFRNAIDKLYEEIINSLDDDRAKQRIFTEIQLNSNDLIRVMGESRIKMILQNIKAEFSLTDLAKGIGAGIFATSVLDIPAVASVVGVSILSTVNVKVDDLFQPKGITDELKPYAYLYHAHKQLI